LSSTKPRSWPRGGLQGGGAVRPEHRADLGGDHQAARIRGQRPCLAEPAAPATDSLEPEAAGAADAGPPEPAGKFADNARRKHELVQRQ